MSDKYSWCDEMLSGSHMLIAGCSGSGKSVALRDIIYTAMLQSNTENLFLLIDLKKVELIDFADSIHSVGYIDEPEYVLPNLEMVCNIMDHRYKEMQRQRQKQTDEPTLWIVIDEYADLVVSCPREVQTCIQRISQVGRACGVKLILCTQRPTREIIRGSVTVNLDTRLALRTVTAQDSKNIIQVKGAESLPDYGKGILQIKGKNRVIDIPYTSDADVAERVNYWTGLVTRQNRF